MSTLAEELFLLADDRVTGRPLIDHTHLSLGLGGALLFDLLLLKRIALVDGHVCGVDLTDAGDQLLDKALTSIAHDVKLHEPDFWVRRLARNAYHDVQSRLMAEGVLRREDHKIFGLLPVHQTPQADTSVEHAVTDQLRDAVVLGHPPSPRTAALASLVFGVGLARHLFPGCDQRAIQGRMAEFAGEQWVVEAVTQTINATNAALGIVPLSDPTE